MKYAKVVISTLIVFLLSGCVKLNVDLQVSADDTVSGNAIIALSDALAGLADSESEAFGEEAFTEGNGIRQVPYAKGGFTGTQIFFQSVPIEIFSQDSDGDDFIKIAREGDNLVTSGKFNFGDDDATQDDTNFLGEDFLEGILSSTDISVSITYPGEILETNGTISGNTITWKPVFGAENEINAIVKSPELSPVFQYLIIGVVVLILIFALVLIIGKHKQDKSKIVLNNQKDQIED